MDKKVPFETQQQQEVRLLNGIYSKDHAIEYELYKYCADYFHNHYNALFFAPKEEVNDILQNSFITFWENIEMKRIYTDGDIIKNKNGTPLKGSIRTYFMGIAKLKYLEWAREPYNLSTEDLSMYLEPSFMKHELYADEEEESLMIQIVSDILSKIPSRCNDILVKFYYEGKNLESILQEIPSITSKESLKVKKYKCLENIRKYAQDMMKKYLYE